MPLVPDQKFSTFQDGGDLTDNDIVVGLRGGLNTKFNFPGYLPPGEIIQINQGGTGADNAADARTNLGLGTMAQQDANAVAITGGTAALTSGQVADAPLASTDITNKAYVDALVAGLNFLNPAYAATTANLSGYTYDNGASGVGATLTAGSNGAFSVDGVSPALNARILVKNQSNTAQNGVYILTTVGDVSTPAVLTRATDYNTAAQITPGDYIIVTAGSTQANSSWVETAVVVTVGTDPITFTQFTVAIPVPASQGGTGRTTLTSNALIYGNGTGQVGMQTTGIGVLAALGQNVSGSGSIALTTSPTFVTPVLGAASATSISFGSTALSAYESGAWTPTLTAVTPGDLSVSYSFQQGTYQRIGNTVYISCSIVCTMTYTTASDGIRVNGLPIAVSLGNIISAACIGGTAFTVPSNTTAYIASAASSFVSITYTRSNGNSIALPITQFASGGGNLVNIFFTAQYTV